MDVSDAAEKLPDWAREHLRNYLETGGREGHVWRGVPILILGTIGRKSGRLSALPLIYGRSGGNYLIVASKGGAPEHPGWYLNLAANPEVQLQVGANSFSAQAHSLAGEERQKSWDLMKKIWPSYEDYQAAADRLIPVVELRPNI